MRKLTKGDWSGSYPGTNIVWMLYLTELLLSSDKPIPGIAMPAVADERVTRAGTDGMVPVPAPVLVGQRLSS